MSRYLWLISLSLLVAAPAQAERLRIVVGGANFRPYPVAAPDLGTDGGANPAEKRLARELTAILQMDIDLVRPLTLVPISTYLAPEREPWTAPSFANWVNVGASGLVRGMVSVKGESVSVTWRFYDVVAQREILGRGYEAPKRSASRVVHRFVDDMVELLTGEAGIFSTRIAYVKRTKTGKAVFVSDVDGSDPERVTPADTLSLLPTWDTSGRYLLFTSYMKSNPDLFRLELASEQLEWLSSKRGLNTGAAVSPDGKHIALTLSLDGNTEIYVMDWDGNNLRRLTDSWGQDVSPTWSPDGKRIAFVSSRSGNPHIYIINADGTAPRRLTFQGNYNQEPDWSPRADGQIAFTARDEFLKYDIFLVHPDSGEISRLTQDEGNNESPSFSPDGHQLAFTSTRDAGGKQIYIMNVDGSSQRRITRQAGEFETPAWGPRLGYEGK